MKPTLNAHQITLFD